MPNPSSLRKQVSNYAEDADYGIAPNELEANLLPATGIVPSFQRGVRSATIGLSAADYLSDALSAEAEGDLEGAALLRQEAARLGTEQQGFAPRVQEARQVSSLRDAADYAAGAVGSGLPSIAPVVSGALLARAGLGRTLGADLATSLGAGAATVPIAQDAAVARQEEDPTIRGLPAQQRLGSANLESLLQGGVSAALPGAARLAGGAFTAPLKGTLARAGAGILEEGASGVASELVSQGFDTNLNPNRDKSDDVYDAFEAGLQEAFGGAPFALPGIAKDAFGNQIAEGARTGLDKGKQLYNEQIEPALQKGKALYERDVQPTIDEAVDGLNKRIDDTELFTRGEKGSAYEGAAQDGAKLKDLDARQIAGAENIRKQLLENADEQTAATLNGLDLTRMEDRNNLRARYAGRKGAKAVQEFVQEGVDVAKGFVAGFKSKDKQQSLYGDDADVTPAAADTILKYLRPEIKEFGNVGKMLPQLARAAQALIEGSPDNAKAYDNLNKIFTEPSKVLNALALLSPDPESAKDNAETLSERTPADPTEDGDLLRTALKPEYRGRFEQIAEIVASRPADDVAKMLTKLGIDGKTAGLIMQKYKTPEGSSANIYEEGDYSEKDVDGVGYHFSAGSPGRPEYVGLKKQDRSYRVRAKALRGRINAGNADVDYIGYNQYLKDTGKDPQKAFEELKGDLEKRVADSRKGVEEFRKKGDEAGAVAKEFRDGQLYEELRNITALERNPKFKPKDAFNAYAVGRTQNVDQNTEIASDEDLKEFGLLARRSTKETAEQIRPTLVSVVNKDGKTIKLSAESIIARIGKYDRSNPGESDGAREQRLFKEGMAMVLAREDIKGIAGALPKDDSKEAKAEAQRQANALIRRLSLTRMGGSVVTERGIVAKRKKLLSGEIEAQQDDLTTNQLIEKYNRKGATKEQRTAIEETLDRRLRDEEAADRKDFEKLYKDKLKEVSVDDLVDEYADASTERRENIRDELERKHAATSRAISEMRLKQKTPSARHYEETYPGYGSRGAYAERGIYSDALRAISDIDAGEVGLDALNKPISGERMDGTKVFELSDETTGADRMDERGEGERMGRTTRASNTRVSEGDPTTPRKFDELTGQVLSEKGSSKQFDKPAYKTVMTVERGQRVPGEKTLPRTEDTTPKLGKLALAMQNAKEAADAKALNARAAELKATSKERGKLIAEIKDTAAKLGMPVNEAFERAVKKYTGRERITELTVAGLQTVLDKLKAKSENIQHSAIGRKAKKELTKKQQQEIKDALLVELGSQKVKVLFKKNLGSYGEYDKISKTITLELAQSALNARSTAFHESMHQFVDALRTTTIDRAIKADIESFGNALATKAQLRGLLKGHPAALKSAMEDPMEAVAYAYQFWKAKQDGYDGFEFNASPKMSNFFNRLTKFIRDLLGIMNQDERMETLFRLRSEGKLSTPGTVAAVLELKGATTLGRRFEKVAPSIAKGLDKLTTSATDRLRDLNLPAATKIADLMQPGVGHEKGNALGMLQTRRKMLNQWKKRASDILGKYSSEELVAANLHMQSMKKPTKPIHRELRSMLDDFKKYMDEAGVMTLVDKGPKEKQDPKAPKGMKWAKVGHVENYWPRQWDATLLDSQYEQAKKDFLGSKVFSSEEALEEFVQAVKTGNGQLELGEHENHVGFTPWNASVNARKLTKITPANAALFAKYQNQDIVSVLTSYMEQGVHRAEFARVLGNHGERLDALLDQAKAQGATDDERKQIVMTVQGLNGTLGSDINPMTRKVMAGVMTAQNLALLPFSLFSNLVDPMGIALRTGNMAEAWNALKTGMKDLMAFQETNDDQELAKTLGLIETNNMLSVMGDAYNSVYMGKTLERTNNLFFRLNGMESWNKSMRVSAMSAGMRFMVRHAKTPDKHSARYLEELGLKASDVQELESGNIKVTQAEGLSAEQEKRVQDAVFRFVDSAVIRPSAADRPVWGSDPHWMLVFHLKQFNFSFQNVILKRVRHELDNGNNLSAGILLSYIPAMFVADLLRGSLTGSANMSGSLMSVVANETARSGVLGVGSFAVDVANDAARGNFPGTSLLGPAAGHAEMALSTAFGNTTGEQLFFRTVPAGAALKHL